MVGIQPDIPWFVNSTPATKTMYSAWKKYQPGILTNSNFNELAVEGWASGLLLGAALKGADVSSSQPVSAADVLDGLYTIHDNTLGGISPEPMSAVPATGRDGETTRTIINMWKGEL